MPDAATLTQAEHHVITKRRKTTPCTPAPHPTTPRKPSAGVVAYRLRISHPVLTVLRDLIDHPGEFYGLELFNCTRVDQAPSTRCSTACAEPAGSPAAPKTDNPGSPEPRPDAAPGRRRTYYNLAPQGHRAALQELHHHKTDLAGMSNAV